MELSVKLNMRRIGMQSFHSRGGRFELVTFLVILCNNMYFYGRNHHYHLHSVNNIYQCHSSQHYSNLDLLSHLLSKPNQKRKPIRYVIEHVKIVANEDFCRLCTRPFVNLTISSIYSEKN